MLSVASQHSVRTRVAVPQGHNGPASQLELKEAHHG
jgi:hypothetical protein